jgi:hypothetical protein
LIETLLNFSELTIEEVTGRLKAVDHRERLPSEPVTVSVASLSSSRSSGSSTSGSGRREGFRFVEQPQVLAVQARQGGTPDGTRRERKATHNDTCKNCGRTDH